jgi:hypothetical protein
MVANQHWPDLTSTDMPWSCRNATSLKDGLAGIIYRPMASFLMMNGALFWQMLILMWG